MTHTAVPPHAAKTAEGGIPAAGPAAGRVGYTAESLFRSHGAMVWRALRYLGVVEQDLADASQEVFVVVHRRLPEFRGASRPETWLYGIALRVAKTFRRRRGGPEQPVPHPPEGTVDPPQEHELRRRRARELILRALDTLDPRQREVFILHEIEQLPMADVARVVECPRFTAYSRLRLARKRMRRHITDWLGEEVP